MENRPSRPFQRPRAQGDAFSLCAPLTSSSGPVAERDLPAGRPPHPDAPSLRPCHTAGTVPGENGDDMRGQDQAIVRQVDQLSDAEEVGLSTRLLFSIPLMRALVQAVAESEGDWNFLNVSVSSGAWVGVGRRSGEEQLAISTNDGSRAAEPYPSPLHETLVGHGFRFVQGHEGYLRFFGFGSDNAFQDVARLIVGTLSHAWRTPMDDHLRVELQLSLPPANDGVTH
jgi:hypothetical protein